MAEIEEEMSEYAKADEKKLKTKNTCNNFFIKTPYMACLAVEMALFV